jgi:DNA-binding beta-propeller fold protein YncE
MKEAPLSRSPRARHAVFAVAPALLALALAADGVAGQDREYGPPWIIETSAVPAAIAVHGRTVTVVEPLNHRLSLAEVGPGELSAEPVWTALGDVADRSAPAALAFPEGVAADEAGNLYVADTGHDRVVLYRRDASGAYAIDPDFARDGPPAADPRPLDLPRDVAVGPAGSVYVLDAGNKRILVADGPDARRWRLHRADPMWEQPSGLAVAPDGELWLADAGAHRVLRLPPAGAAEEIGGYGAEGGGLRYPHDVAVDPSGDRVYVADTHNHRIAVFTRDGELVRSLGSAPLLGRPTHVTVDASGRVWAADAANAWVVAWPGRGGALAGADADAAFDGYLRDDRTDTGEEGADGPPAMSSPDVLVRHAPDVDLDVAERETLGALGEDLPAYGRSNHLYFEVRNRGDEPLVGSAIAVWTADPGSPGFPTAWDRDDFYAAWRDGTGVPRNFVEVGFVPPGGRAVTGPLVWRPEAPPGGGSCADETLLMARIVDLGDPIMAGGGLERAAGSNNVIVRQLPVVPPGCVPPGDRYERNDRIEAIAHVDEVWEHLAARCPRTITRELGEPYPDTECPGIFENGVAPSGAEEIWNLVVPDLSLHGTTDRDFFEIALPDLRDPVWGLDDINPEEVRIRAAGDPTYTPEPMPECGAVQRRDPGPSGRDNTVWINVTTTLTITASPTDGSSNAITDRTLDTSGEAVRVYRDGEPAPAASTGTRLVRHIVCPRDVEGLGPVELSFGERTRADGSFDRRPLEALGGYELRLTYLASIDRGIPSWAREHNDGRGIRTIPCLPRPGAFPGPGGLPGGSGGFLPGGRQGFGGFGLFPLCLGRPGSGPITIFPGHPRTPKLPGCIADGPGCMELSRFRWGADRQDLDLLIRAPVDLKVRLLRADGKEVARARPIDRSVMLNRPPDHLLESLDPGQPDATGGGKWTPSRLRARRLPAGDYYLEISGPATDFAIQYRPLEGARKQGETKRP